MAGEEGQRPDADGRIFVAFPQILLLRASRPRDLLRVPRSSFVISRSEVRSLSLASLFPHTNPKNPFNRILPVSANFIPKVDNVMDNGIYGLKARGTSIHI